MDQAKLTMKEIYESRYIFEMNVVKNLKNKLWYYNYDLIEFAVIEYKFPHKYVAYEEVVKYIKSEDI